MTEDLFGLNQELEYLSIQDAEVYYQPHFDLGNTPDTIARQLIEDTPWRSETIFVWGKKFTQPRLVAWYGDEGKSYTYSGINLNPLPWTKFLLDIRQRVERAVNSEFNSVLLNYYRNNRDSMGFHSDDEPELGIQPVIASVSLGEERTLILKHKTSRLLKPVRIKLASGSLLLMRGQTQRNWKHGIDKETRPSGARVNLTFRYVHV